MIVEQLAYGNANTACQAALRPFRERGDISDIIWICSDIGPSYTQGLAMAAALWEFQLKIFYFNKKIKAQGEGGLQSLLGIALDVVRKDTKSGSGLIGEWGRVLVVSEMQEWEALG